MPSLSYRPTRRDLLDACQLHDLGVVLGWRMLSLAGAYTVGVGVLIAIGFSTLFSPLVAGLAAGGAAVAISGVMLILRRLLVPRYLVRRLLRDSRAAAGEWQLTWTQEGYSVRGETASSVTAWGHYVRWCEDGRVILLYQSWQSYQFVPKRLLAPKAQEFIVSQLRAAGVPRARGWTKR